MSHFIFAAVVTEDNKQSIIEHVAKFRSDLIEDLKFIIDDFIIAYTGRDEVPMAFLSLPQDPTQTPASFTIFGSKYFYSNYQFDYTRTEGLFTQAHRL